jgi:1-acyl-sn-glycerol-3-phosphate acyltransferase
MPWWEKVLNTPSLVIPALAQILRWHIYYYRLPPKLKTDADSCNLQMVNACRNYLQTVYQVEFRGLQHVVENRPTLYVMRHACHLDFLVVAGIHKKCRFVTKAGLIKHKSIGFMTLKSDHIVVNVKDPASRQAAKIKMKKLLCQGQSLVVLPEGQLARTEELLPFHTSSLQMACELGIAVVTITLQNASQTMWEIPNKPLIVTFHPPMVYDDVDTATKHVRHLMISHTQFMDKKTPVPFSLHRVTAFVFLLLFVLCVCARKYTWAVVTLSAAVVLTTHVSKIID